MPGINEQPKNMSLASANSAKWRNNPYYRFHKGRGESKKEIGEAVDKSLEKFVPSGVQDDLNRELWDDQDKLKSEIRKQLKKIAVKFIESIGLKAPIKDVIFTGSMANYNWTDTSDIDLHIVINFDDVDDNTEFVRDYFDIQKALWGLKHDITVKGHDVELYVQDEREEHHSSGIYSIKNDDWIVKPEKENVKVDKESVRKKSQMMADMINALAGIKDDEERESESDAIKEKIRKMRQTGLSSAGEYSVENLAFKTLRNSGYLEKLSDTKINSFDKSLTLDEDFAEAFKLIDEESSSKSQQRFFGIVRGLQLGEIPLSKASKKARKAAKDMSHKDVEDFASTDHDGLPEKVKEDMVPGGLSDDMTYEDIANKHGVSSWEIISQLHKGVQVEMEHTDDAAMAKEIALDHLLEDPKYYDKLDRMESGDLNESSVNHKYEKGCLMLQMDIPTWDSKILSKIEEGDLYEDEPGFGLEKDPHATVLFGFHDDEIDYEDIIQKTRDNCSGPLKIEVKGASCFEGDKYDVLKFDVDGKELHRLNGVMKEGFSHSNDYPNYQPHITIAYLKPGMGKRYASKFKPQALVLEGAEMSYSAPSGKRINWPLNPNIPVDRLVKYNSKNGDNSIFFHKGDGMTPEKMELLRDFVEFVCLKVGMENPITIHFRNGRDEYIKTTASYVPSENSNHINYQGRSLVDICRSIAHELTHNRQIEIGKFNLGEEVQNIGGEIENEADSVAGMLIKDFTHNNGYDEIYDL